MEHQRCSWSREENSLANTVDLAKSLTQQSLKAMEDLTLAHLPKAPVPKSVLLICTSKQKLSNSQRPAGDILGLPVSMFSLSCSPEVRSFEYESLHEQKAQL